MSIVLKDGTVLPDLPDGLITEERPYAFILRVANYYGLYSTDAPAWYVPPEMAGTTNGAGFLLCNCTVTLLSTFYTDTSDWGQPNNVTAPLELPINDVVYFAWSNHDIFVLETMDENLNFSGTEVYFPGSVSKPPFVLPDGTELPALPDGCFDGTPYGAVAQMYRDETNEIYSFFAMAQPTVGLPYNLMPDDWKGFIAEVNEYLCTPLGAYKQWNCQTKGSDEEPAWLLVDDAVSDMAFPIGPVNVTPWVNHDALRVTSFGADGSSYTIGTEIARKSDENYRVTGGYMTSIANEARRLGGKTGGMLPAVTEATLRGVTAGGGGDGPQLAPNERIYQVGAATGVLKNIVFTSNATGTAS